MPLVATHSSGIFHAMHIYTHPEFIHHDVAEGHPERPDRLRHLLDHLDREGILDDCQLREPSDHDAYLAAHTAEHFEFLRRSGSQTVSCHSIPTWMGTASTRHDLRQAPYAAAWTMLWQAQSNVFSARYGRQDIMLRLIQPWAFAYLTASPSPGSMLGADKYRPRCNR